MDDQQRGTVLMAAGYGFGAVGLAAPKLMSAIFGVRNASDEYAAAMRMVAARNIALAQAFRLVSDDDKMRKRFFTVAASLFAADSATALLSALTGRITWRTALSLGATTGALAAIAAGGAATD